MKKTEMIKQLLDEGFDVDETLKWSELQKYYKEKMEEVKSRNSLEMKKPDEKDVEEKLERKLEKEPDTRTPLERLREKVYPQIVDLMRRLNGRSTATQGELQEMFRLYNQFYMRNDQPSCGACVARVFRTFQKITKGHL